MVMPETILTPFTKFKPSILPAKQWKDASRYEESSNGHGLDLCTISDTLISQFDLPEHFMSAKLCKKYFILIIPEMQWNAASKYEDSSSGHGCALWTNSDTLSLHSDLPEHLESAKLCKRKASIIHGNKNLVLESWWMETFIVFSCSAYHLHK